MGEGSRPFQQGAFAQAIVSWTEAARLYERVGKPNKQSEVLTHLAQAYQSIDQYRRLKLLHNPRYQHPDYWSPFLPINNWQ